VYGGVPYEVQEEALRNGVDVIVATPGRLLDHLEKGNVVFDDLEVLILDEADRMLDMGFAPQINRVVEQIPPYRQTLLFSATMPPEVEALARKYLRKPVVVQVGRRNTATKTVTHAVYPVPRDRKASLLVELLRKPEMDTVLVFVRTKPNADRVVRHLEEAGIASVAMHGDKTQVQRIQALEDFRSGAVRVLVATDIAQLRDPHDVVHAEPGEQHPDERRQHAAAQRAPRHALRRRGAAAVARARALARASSPAHARRAPLSRRRTCRSRTPAPRCAGSPGRSRARSAAPSRSRRAP